GSALDVGAFRVDPGGDNRRVGARGLLPASVPSFRMTHAATGLRRMPGVVQETTNVSRAIGSGAKRNRQPKNGGLPTVTSEELLLSGMLPPQLLHPGVNTLLVEVIAARDQRVHASVGFVAVPAATGGRPGGGSRPRKPKVSPGRLPKGAIATR